jgi:hypothetical protein
MGPPRRACNAEWAAGWVFAGVGSPHESLPQPGELFGEVQCSALERFRRTLK